MATTSENIVASVITNNKEIVDGLERHPHLAKKVEAKILFLIRQEDNKNCRNDVIDLWVAKFAPGRAPRIVDEDEESELW